MWLVFWQGGLEAFGFWGWGLGAELLELGIRV